MNDYQKYVLNNFNLKVNGKECIDSKVKVIEGSEGVILLTNSTIIVRKTATDPYLLVKVNCLDCSDCGPTVIKQYLSGVQKQL